MSIALFITLVAATLILLKAFCIYCYKERRRRNRFDHSDEDITIEETVGLDKESLNALPVVEYKQENLIEGLECAVCLSEFVEKEKLRVLPNCDHGFHRECIDMWLHSHTSCPLCRKTVHPVVNSNGLKSVNGEEEFYTNNSVGEQRISLDFDPSNESVVHGHQVRGQRRCGMMHCLIPLSIDFRATENEMDQGLLEGRPLPHISIEIEFS